MVMTNNDVVRDWAAAKNPAAQIAVLADLNATKPDIIKKILREQGAGVIANAYEQGAGLEKLSKYYGFAPMTIRAMIIEAGGTIREQKDAVKAYSRAKNAVQPAKELAEEQIEEKQSLSVYQLAEVLAQIVPELCDGFDVEISQMGNETKIIVYGNSESVTYRRCDLSSGKG